MSRTLGLLSVLAFQTLFGQTGGAGQGTILPTPDRVLYFVLLDSITKHDAVAAQQTALGKDGTPFRNYYASAIGLTPADFQILHDNALTCRAVIANIDDSAAALIKSFRAQATAAQAKGDPLPPIPPVLSTMQQQRDSTVLGCVAQIKQAMTPAGAQKLDQYVHQQLTNMSRPGHPGN